MRHLYEDVNFYSVQKNSIKIVYGEWKREREREVDVEKTREKTSAHMR